MSHNIYDECLKFKCITKKDNFEYEQEDHESYNNILQMINF